MPRNRLGRVKTSWLRTIFRPKGERDVKVWILLIRLFTRSSASVSQRASESYPDDLVSVFRALSVYHVHCLVNNYRRNPYRYSRRVPCNPHAYFENNYWHGAITRYCQERSYFTCLCSNSKTIEQKKPDLLASLRRFLAVYSVELNLLHAKINNLTELQVSIFDEKNKRFVEILVKFRVVFNII